MRQRLTRLAAPLVGAALLGLAALAGCAGPTAPDSSPPATTPADTPAPAAGAGGKVLLAVSFGTSHNDNRELSIGGVEAALQTAYPDHEVRRAFTSQIIIDKLKDRDGLAIDNVDQALAKIVADGVQDLVIVPTAIMGGYEYMDLVAATAPYQPQFTAFAIASPLLTSEADFAAVAQAITARTAEHEADDTAIVFMGHGTSAPSNAAYEKLNGILKADHKNYFVGTVEGSPTLADVIAEAQAAQVEKVVLQPLMVVAGDHANNDMAGDEDDSWKSEFTKAGFEVTTLLEGLGQNPAIQQLYVEHAQAAITASAEFTPPTPDASTAPVAEGLAAHQITPGEYAITATTSGSMFKIVDAALAVEEESMRVTITLSGDGYGRLVLGTAANAAQASSGFIDFTTDAEGRHVYLVPVSRLDKPMAFAAESGKTPGKWYDQTITFSSDDIPADAITG
ncbi:MAG: sirohydrochlorin cobaltochelatase [Propionibacteriaceae bacterium]|jgi:sirohydrochlorin cobaltochelatase|nr:sirohydrochlorin cobaltochelatase [Propionibacteriaceae bacterium]